MKRGEIDPEEYDERKKQKSQIAMSRVAALIVSGNEMVGIDDMEAYEKKKEKAELSMM